MSIGQRVSGSLRSRIEARRIFDCLFVAIALLCLAPLIATIAAAVWLESGSPVFFSQVRLGKAGRPFRLHKFRKFLTKEQTSGLAVTLRDDPRFTRVGRVLERTKLDELPQLWNILVGEMALVGPRPESLAFADCFDGAYCRVLDHKPGIFGPCQVVFRHESRLYEQGCDAEMFYRQKLFPLKASIDLAYFHNRTMISDISWTFRTIGAVFSRSPQSNGNLQDLDAVERWVQDFSQVAARPHPASAFAPGYLAGHTYASSTSASAIPMAQGD